MTAVSRSGHVAIVGRPSVGKSTLLNRLVGHKLSITSKKPQTTRHRIIGILTESGTQFVFVDTPGFQTQHRSRLHDRMNRTVRESLESVDAVVLVVDATRLTLEDEAIVPLLPRERPVIVAVNKIDELRDKAMLLPRLARIAAWREFGALVPISAEKGTQLGVLKAEIAKALPAGAPLYDEDTLTDRDERFLAAEFVREQVFRRLGDELPYATTVDIERFEDDGKLRRVAAVIYVEKASQRAIVLGEGGAAIKAIATNARREMEQLFGGKVFLEVWVRVKRGWAGSDASLARMGY